MNLYQSEYIRSLSKFASMDKSPKEDPHFIENSEIILDQITSLEDHFLSEEIQNTVRIAALPNIAYNLLPPILKEMSLLGYHYEIFIIDESKIIEEQFYMDEYDIGFAQDLKLGSICMIKEPYYAIVPKDSPFSEKSVTTIHELMDTPLILPDVNCDIRISFDKLLKKYSYCPNSFIEVSQNDPIISFVECGMGVTIAPKMMISNLPDKVKAIEILDDNFYRTVDLLSNSYRLTDLIVSIVNLLSRYS
ncbi:LysR family transcriptional regulator substrate-binding protein [Metaclostridioides mangenotii]|uniref:LysR family transcriptional regulator substrate-binding protein n=1 Tax=Metaclostridioides mangenotii TaxID=1540 RepID=UPI000485A807|nr:LysR family transcriptional regulator substrate-binding protein [Clostridioides mangenotii]